MPDLEQVVPYLPSLNETEQLPPAAMAETPDLAPEAESETLETDKGLGVAVEAEVVLTVPVWFNPEEAAV